MNKEEILREFPRAIASSKTVLIAEQSSVRQSDLIFVFNDVGYLVIITERLVKSDYTRFQWDYIKKETNKIKLDPDVKVSFKAHDRYLDITFYKQWWLDWLLERG